MTSVSFRPCGDFRTSYQSDTRIFDTTFTRWAFVAFIVALLFAPLVLDLYILNLFIFVAIYGIAALGLNILVGFTGQISLGHAVFFGFGAFSSAWLSVNTAIPVLLCIPLGGLATAAVGMLFGLPAARIKGLYLAIATLAAQFILEDFFQRAEGFTGGVYGSVAQPIEIFGHTVVGDEQFFYVALFFLVVMYLLGTNLMRSRDGRAFVAVRDHYLSAEIMGINLTTYRLMSFGVSSFYAGVAGGLYAHYLEYVSAEGFTILLSIQFLAMIIIGGLGSVKGALFGTVFMVLLPEVMEGVVGVLSSTPWGNTPFLVDGVAFIKEMAIGLAIVLFLIFEPDGLAHRWRQIRAYWKLYPFSY